MGSSMLTALLVAALAAAPTPHKTKIAIFDFEDVTGNVGPQARLLTQVATTEVLQGGKFDVISSAEVRSLIGLEKQRKLLGCQEDSSCLAEIGGALGVDFMITGQLGKLGERYRLDLRLLNTSRSAVAASEGQFIAGKDDALGDVCVTMVRKLLADAGLRAPDPAGGLTATAPSDEPSRTPAYVTLAAAGVLAAGAALMTLQAHSTYTTAQGCYGNAAVTVQSCKDGDASLKWQAPLADALWVGALATGGLSAYFFLRSPDSPSGAGGDIGVRGRF
jgi:TolB-like protein